MEPHFRGAMDDIWIISDLYMGIYIYISMDYDMDDDMDYDK